MVNILRTTAPDFDKKFHQWLLNAPMVDTSIQETVATILSDIKTEGNNALLRYTKILDRLDIPAEKLRISKEELLAAWKNASDPLKKALLTVKERILAYHRKQMPQDFDTMDTSGIRLGNVWRPMASAGIYVPGGKARYPSSVLMNALPARVAGVSRIAMVVPTPDGNRNQTVLAAAHIAEIDEVYTIGGAQAIAALAYGTETIAPVDIITGPGNAYVTEAKRKVFGQVGIDMLAGPSEILVIADLSANPQWIAADLLSQAEHDEMSRSILICTDENFAHQVINAVDHHLTTLPRKTIAAKSWEKNGMVFIVRTTEETIALANKIAPEHLELAVNQPEAILPKIMHAGAIFLGHYTPEAIGDYSAGPSHVLPTSGTARFSSGLSVFHFLKRISVIGCNQQGFLSLAGSTHLLAEEEGLNAHALSISLRRPVA